MVNFKNVRAVKFTAMFDGEGCVNFDSVSQRFFLNSNGLGSDFTQNKNIALAKKIFKNVVTPDGKNKTLFKYKVSSDCLRHAIYEDVMPFQNPSISSVPTILYNAIAMPCYITRGYLFTQKSSNSLKKRGITICDAYETGEWRDSISFDFHSRTGGKDTSVKEEDDSNDTTIYNIENIGINTYSSEGYIDLTELQFISADPLYDRMAVDADGGANEIIYLNALKRNLPTFNGNFDYYYIKNTYCNDEWAERGILLDKESVDFLIKDVFKHIMNVNITRRNAYFRFKSLCISVIMDDGVTENTITITPDNINDFTFEYSTKYFVADEAKIQANKDLMDQAKEISKQMKKDEKTAKEEAKKNKKNNKN